MTWSFECCDLLENTYLCGSNNNIDRHKHQLEQVVICLKIRTFVVATTTTFVVREYSKGL